MKDPKYSKPDNKSNKTNYRRPQRTGRGNKSQRRDEEVVDTVLKGERSTTNDPSWYQNFPSIADDAGKIGFGTAVGQKVNLGASYGYASPSLCAIYFEPTIGISDGPDSPINRSAQGMYSYLRSKLRLANNYDKSDLMIMIIALDSLHMFHSFLRRAYGIATLYTPTNREFPELLLETMGIDISVIDDLSRFRSYINQFAVRMGRYALPGKIDLVTRHQWMCSGLYADKPNTRSQTYMFVPSGFWKYNNTVATGSQLDFVAWSRTGDATLDDIIAFGDNLLSAIFGDEDAGDISGDLLNAYGEESMLSMPETEDGYRIVPVYDEMVLSQINNLRILGTPTAATNVITQNPSVNNGAILFQPEIVTNIAPAYSYRHVLNAYHDKPTPSEVMEMTRFVPDYTFTFESGNYTIKPTSTGSEIVSAVILVGKVKQINSNGSAAWAQRNQLLVSNNIQLAVYDALESTLIFGMISAFDWHFPITIEVSPTATMDGCIYPLWDVDNFVDISENMLENLNYVALLSQFHAPNSYM